MRIKTFQGARGARPEGFTVYLHRWMLIVHWMNERDRYGFEGSQGYSLRLTVVKNP